MPGGNIWDLDEEDRRRNRELHKKPDEEPADQVDETPEEKQ